jgi:hypothetical protein
MFDPMWDPKVSVFGLPAEAFVAAAGLLGMTVGLLWIRQITRDDLDMHSFLETSHQASGPGWIGILGIALVGVLLILGAIFLARQDAPPASSLLVKVALGGALVAGSALLLAVRRAWYRIR